jgi:hypothetical protein
VETASLTPERRPFVKVTADGKPYILVHTRRGPRTRQVSAAGWEWVRARYPAERYRAPEDVPLTYADYQYMRSLGFTGTSDAQRPAAPGDRPLFGCSGAELFKLFKERSFDAAVLMQLAHELQYRNRPRMRALRQQVNAALNGGGGTTPSPRTTATVRAPAVACPSCGATQRQSARFCPACGSPRDGGAGRRTRVSEPTQPDARPTPSPSGRREWSNELHGVLLVAAVCAVIVLIVILCQR